MKLSELEAKIEAILFTMGEAVELERIAAATEQDEDTCRKVIRSMMDNYAAEDRGIQIIELDGAFQMCTKADMYERSSVLPMFRKACFNGCIVGNVVDHRL